MHIISKYIGTSPEGPGKVTVSNDTNDIIIALLFIIIIILIVILIRKKKD